MAARQKKPIYHHIDPLPLPSATKQRKKFDYDFPLDTKASFNSNTGVKSIGKRTHAGSAFGRLRVFNANGPITNKRRPADGLETRDSRAWASALRELGDGHLNPPSKKSERAADSGYPQIKTNSPACRSSTSSPLTASTDTSSTTTSTIATTISNLSNKKRKAEEMEPIGSDHEGKKRRIAQSGGEHNVVEPEHYDMDIDMCSCDDPSHNLSRE